MSGFADYDSFDALGLAELVRKREVSAAELLDQAIARLETVNPRLNAVVIELFDHARAQLSSGLADGPFAGVPFLLKDLYAFCAGTPMTNGSRLYEGYVCDHDSTLVARYKRAGLVIFGRTNSPELGLSYTTEPVLYGPTRNPWNPDRTAGGSSGGAAAAVAAGIVPAAHASDGGGSIRVPASCCGLFGLKPTRGRTPVGPGVGEGWAGMAIGHAITRSVRDSAALLDATAGPDLGDPYWAPPPERPYLAEVGAAPGRLRIAVSAEAPNRAPVDPDCVAAMTQAARLCADLGHTVEEAAPEFDRDAMDEAKAAVIAANLQADIATWGAERGRPATPDELEPASRAFAQMADAVTAPDYVNAVHALHRVGRQIARFLLDYDLLLTPSMARPPLEIGVLDPTREDTDAYIEDLVRFAAFPPLSNVTGAPAMSLPLSWNDDGLPIGVQFVGRFGDEATLFRLAAQIEAAAPWAGRRPPLERAD